MIEESKTCIDEKGSIIEEEQHNSDIEDYDTEKDAITRRFFVRIY